MTTLFALVLTTTNDFMVETSVLGIYTSESKAKEELNNAISKARRDFAEEVALAADEDGYVLNEGETDWELYKDGSAADFCYTLQLQEVEQDKSIKSGMTATEIITYVDGHMDETKTIIKELAEGDIDEPTTEEEWDGMLHDLYSALQDRMGEEQVYEGRNIKECIDAFLSCGEDEL